MAHRVRCGVHTILSEDDHFERDSLSTGLMRAALAALAETRGQRANKLLPAKGSRVQAFARGFRL